MKELVVVGYGGLGREASWLAQECGYAVQGFLDDAVEVGTYGQYRVLGSVSTWKEFKKSHFIVAIGNPRARKRVVTAMKRLGIPAFATLVHPSVIMPMSTSIGAGSMIYGGTTGTVDFEIGKHVVIYSNCTITHDDCIGDFVTLCPGVVVSGNVTLGHGVEVGAGAIIRQGLTMGVGSMLGMGGVLTKSVEPDEVYVGSPAKPFKTLASFADI